MDARRRLFIGLYALSGAAALVYQVTWTRLFTFQLGHTVAAASTVLAAFMGGLAGGAWLAGRLLPAQARRLQAYATLELLVALMALALPAILKMFLPALSWAYADGEAPILFGAVRVALSLFTLGLPAAAMGATYPIAAAWLAGLKPGTGTQSAADAGVLYAANTAGAAAGAIAAGFWLVPALGLRGATWVGVALNGGAALGALWLARRGAAVTEEPAELRQPKTSPRESRRRRSAPRPIAAPQPGLACAAAALSGFLALAYEVAWTRLLALVIGPTTYAFATMAASFISGIALGSWAGARLARRVSHPALWLAAMLVVTAVSASLTAWFASSRLPLLVAYQVASGSGGFQSLVLRQAFSVGLLLLPMTFSLGMTFTLALTTAASGLASVGRDTARVYAANTLGAVAGALAAGFVLVPRLGLQATFVGMSRLGAIGGVVLASVVLIPRTKGNPRTRGFVVASSIGVVLVAILVDGGGWDRDLLSSGAYKYSQDMSTDELEASLRAGRLEYYKEGAAATVSVRRLGGSRALAVDGKVDASSTVDMLTQRLLGILPILLHPNPHEICIIGLGSGVTLGSALASGQVRRADVVEISPEVVEASAFFVRENGDVLRKPGVRLVIGDGRSHLLLSERQYDVIVSEPSNPWMAGVAALFTREFFEAARARLKPDGLLCQWAHAYEMSAGDLKSIVRTFASVFPQGTIWLVGDGDLLLIGTTGKEIMPRLAGVAQRWRLGSLPSALADVAVDPSAAPFELLSMFAGGPAELAYYSDGAVLQTDDRMALEFTAPRAIYARTSDDNAAEIRALRSGGRLPPIVADALASADARSWTLRGRMALQAESFEMAAESFHRAVSLDSRDPDALRGVSEAASGAHQIAEEVTFLKTLAAAEPANSAVRIELSYVLASNGDYEGAIAAAEDAVRLDPDGPRPVEQLASIFADVGDADRLSPLADALVTRFPERVEGQYYHAAVLFLRGRAMEAADEGRRLLAAHPGHAKAQNLLGAACATTGERECAQQAFEASIRLSPQDAAPYVNLGLFYLQTANPAAAKDSFAEAVAIDPTSQAAKNGLAQARAVLDTP